MCQRTHTCNPFILPEEQDLRAALGVAFEWSAAPMMVVRIGDLGIEAVNQSCADLYQLSRQQLESATLADINRTGTQGIYRKIDQIRHGTALVRNLHTAAEGRSLEVESQSRIFWHRGQEYMLNVLRDISDPQHFERTAIIQGQVAAAFLRDSEEDIFNQLLQVIQRFFDCRYGLVGYIDDMGNLVAPSLTRDIWQECRVPDKTFVFPQEHWGGLFGRALAERTCCFANGNLHLPQGHIQLENALACSILAAGKLVGLFIVANRNQPFSNQDRDSAQVFSQVISPVLRHWLDGKRHRDALQRERDQLEVRIQDELQRASERERILFEQQKFVDMGQMVNAIAHHWRQPLNNIYLLSQVMAEIHAQGEQESGEYAQSFAEQEQLIHRMSETIDDFRTFFGTSPRQEEFSILDEVLSVYQMVQAQFDAARIGFEVSCACALRTASTVAECRDAQCDTQYTRVHGDPHEFRQVLLCLLSNARDASAEAQSHADALVRVDVRPSPDHISIRIFNNGRTIPEADMPRIFDPYFSTKADGSGSGLGLYVSRVLIQDHMHGSLTATNEPDGVAFDIGLPARRLTHG